MSNRPKILFVLALFATANGAYAENTAGGTYDPPKFNRIRAGVSSSGPRGFRRIDTAIEPATFESLGIEKPMPKAPTPSSEISEPPQDPSTSSAAEPEPTGAASIEKAHSERSLFAASSSSPGRNRKSPLAANPLKSLLAWRPSSETAVASAAGLAIAVGLLLSFIWLLRSLAPKSSRQLPKEVVEVLGRAPLVGKQTTQLVRIGNKLVLVAITPDGAETLTEITDPDEVARLIAACDNRAGRGEGAAFDQLLQQMADERTTPGFLGQESTATGSYDTASFDPRSLAAAYANTPGGRGDA